MREISPDSVDETVESIEACFIVPHSQEKAGFLIPVVFSGTARVLYAFVATQFLRHAPTAHQLLQNMAAGYDGRNPTGEALRIFARELVSLMRRSGFTCRSDSNPLGCKWVRR